MTKSLAYIGVIALVVGVLLTTCVGSAWSMEVLPDEEMAGIRGTVCPNTDCAYGGGCPYDKACTLPWPDCGLSKQDAEEWKRQIEGGYNTTTPTIQICKNCDCWGSIWPVTFCWVNREACLDPYYDHKTCERE